MPPIQLITSRNGGLMMTIRLSKILLLPKTISRKRPLNHTSCHAMRSPLLLLTTPILEINGKDVSENCGLGHCYEKKSQRCQRVGAHSRSDASRTSPATWLIFVVWWIEIGSLRLIFSTLAAPESARLWWTCTNSSPTLDLLPF
jgi:hypothetical protein